jgi:hypothetical protein
MSLVAAEIASATHPRPSYAGKIFLSMVPSFNECTATTPPNRNHGPPLPGASCHPPVMTSTAVTIGTQSVGSIFIQVIAGAPGPPEDSDVRLTANATDIRCTPAALPSACGSTNTSGGADYIGGMEGNAQIRITDHWNGVGATGGPDAATVIDLPFPVVAGCTATPSTTVGATCGVTTTANAVVGGPDPVVKDGKRGVVGIGQVTVTDGGPDGQIGTVGDNDQFSEQGIFIP